MGVIFRLAIRNLTEHKAKTFIIALFLIFGVAIVILGNSFLESVNKGLEKDFRANYTGDFAISTVPEKGTIIDIFSASTTTFTGDIPQIPALPELDKVMEIINNNDDIKCDTKQISAQVLITKGLEVDMSNIDDDINIMDLPVAMLFAGEDKTYWEVFPDLNLIEGRYPTAGTNEVIIDTRVQRNMEKFWHESLNIGENILMMGANTKGIIREAKVVGIFKPADENSAMFQVIYSDPTLARAFADLTYANTFKEELPDTVDLSLNQLDEDDLFGSDDFDFDFDDLVSDDQSILRGETSDFSDILGDTSLRDELNKTDDGSWNFILGKFKNPAQAQKSIEKLQAEFDEEGIPVRVMDWKAAAFSYSGTVEGIGLIFNILIIILAVVVFIIIMNTMTVSVIERTGEIGTMRAIGAEKKFVQKLFFTEAVFLTLVTSIIGIVIAFIAMGIFNSLNITITNEIGKMILGGGLLHFTPTFKIIIMTVVIALAGSILSNIYPVKSALKITPLKALSKGE